MKFLSAFAAAAATIPVVTGFTFMPSLQMAPELTWQRQASGIGGRKALLLNANMKGYLETLVEGQDLTGDDTETIFGQILKE